jgi:hypothetical protein
MGWFKELLMNLYLIDRPIAHRGKPDRRKADRRWKGPEGDMPRPRRDPRRKRERRKKKRR